MNAITMNIGLAQQPAKTATGRVFRSDVTGRAPKPVPRPKTMRKGTNTERVWLQLPNPGDEPVTARKVADALGLEITQVAAALNDMCTRDFADRIGKGPDGYLYTRHDADDAESEGGDADVQTESSSPETPEAREFSPIQALAAQPCDEAEALRDMLEDARAHIAALRDALGVAVEPHQNIEERTLEAARILVAQLAGQKRQLDRQFSTITNLSDQVRALTALLDAREACGYLIRSAKQLRIVRGWDKAQSRALSAARRTGRAQVYALSPVGRAKRGAEWVEG